ncbi:MAG: hypothetical protein JKY52_14415 [Flavobacteriales bacterium]|nr:hypothetical protein [Flavobacteriales bacterium]
MSHKSFFDVNSPSFRFIVGASTGAFSPFIGDIYEPSWISDFNLPPQDAQGWSILTPSATSRIMYVSNTGNDGTATIYNSSSFVDYRNPTSENSYLTIAAAEAQLRDGFDDYVLLNRDDTFALTSTFNFLDGTSIAKRMVLSSYGSGANPVVEHRFTTDGNMVRWWQGAGHFTALQHIDFAHPRKDPDDAEFDGWGVSPTRDDACLNAFHGTTTVDSILIEGCKMPFFNHGITIQGDNHNIIATDVLIRRNIISDSYTDGGGLPAGIFLNGTHVLLEENYFSQCGFYVHASTTSPATVFNHSFYHTHANFSIYRNNISYNPANLHIKERTDPYQSTIAVTLNGAAETAIVCDDAISTELPSTGIFTIELDGGSALDVPYTSFTGSTFTIPSTNFTGDNATLGNEVGANFIESDSVAAYGNSMVDGGVADSFGGNQKNTVAISEAMARFDNHSYQDNVSINIGKSQNTGQVVGFGADMLDHSNAVIEDNYFLPTDNASVTNTFAINEGGYAQSNLITNNHAYLSGNYQLQTPSISNAFDINAAEYTDPTVNIESFMTSIGKTSTAEAFRAEIRLQDVGNWGDITSTNLNTYLKDGFALVNTSVFITDLVDANLVVGEDYVVSVDVISDETYTVEWFVDSVIDLTNTSLTFTKTAATDTFTLRCDIVSSSSTVSSTIADITAPSAHSGIILTLNGTNSYFTYTPVTPSIGDTTSFTYIWDGVNPSGRVTLVGGEASNQFTINSSGNLDIGGTPVFTVTIDTVPYLSGAALPTDGLEHDVVLTWTDGGHPCEFVGRRPTGDRHFDGEIWNLSHNIGGVETSYHVDSEGTDGQTEPAFIGTGTITYHNTIAGDWNAIP